MKQLYRLVTYKKECQGVPSSWEEINALKKRMMENSETDCIYQIEAVFNAKN